MSSPAPTNIIDVVASSFPEQVVCEGSQASGYFGAFAVTRCVLWECGVAERMARNVFPSTAIAVRPVGDEGASIAVAYVRNAAANAAESMPAHAQTEGCV